MTSGEARGTLQGLFARSGTLLMLVWACLIWLPSPARATESHIFDPTLSLTGGCTTDELDSVQDPWCPGPPAPSAPFASPNITIDSYGDMYVGSYDGEGSNGRIDVFSPQGQFITEFPVEGPKDLAVDATGNLYVLEYAPGIVLQVSHFAPTAYKPSEQDIRYETPGEPIVEEEEPNFMGGFLAPWAGLTVNPSSGHVFVCNSGQVAEFGSAEEGNKPLDYTIGLGVLSSNSKSLAVDVSRNRLYVTDSKGGADASFIQVFELKSPHKLLGTITGAKTPNGKFLSDVGFLTLDADEASGHIFISDLSGTNKVYEFGEGLGAEEELLEIYQHKFKAVSPGEVAVDSSVTSPNRGTLFVPSGGTVGHTFAFKHVLETPPVVETISFSGVTEKEIVLQAEVNPEGSATEYWFEYVTEQSFEEEGFAGAATVGKGSLVAGVGGEDVSAPVTDLQPGTAYRFLVVAVNKEGKDEEEATFRTYPAVPGTPTCLNAGLRIGLSGGLPDCRAYELVTPPDTNGRSPAGVGDTGIYFPTIEASPDGSKATFRIEGGSLPGSEGSGAFNGENYLATRGADGWITEIAAPSGTEDISPIPGSVSPDQEHSFWGGLVNGEPASYIRYPDGTSEFVGRGSLGVAPDVEADLITENGAHTLFTTVNSLSLPAMRLEEDAPPEGTTAIYDRTADEVTHVISLLPGNLIPSAGEGASYVGASFDGRGIAFKIGETLYLRYDEETYKVGSDLMFAGVAEGGKRIFYLQGGNLYALDVKSDETINFSKSGDVIPVNVSPDGSAAYFLSPSVLTGEGNPNGAIAQLGKENLYLSREGTISFVGTVMTLDVAGEPLIDGEVLGLGQWIKSLANARPGIDTSRITSDGSVLVFQSRAALGSYDPEGHVEVYRYNSADATLDCLSCNPTLAPASGDASLQSVQETSAFNSFLSTHAKIPNLSPDGRRAFFQSPEPLVKSDTDGVQDVYEWEAKGVGSCEIQAGCVNLISSGQSARSNHLYSVSESGNDVFFLTSDILLGVDRDETPSIYDARVNGGFPEPESTSCQGEACRPPLTAPPALGEPASPGPGPSDNVRTPKRVCPSGKQRVRRHGKVRCVRRHHRHRHGTLKGGMGG